MRSWILKFLIFVNVFLYFTLVALWISIPDELTLNISTSVFNLSLSVLFLYLAREKFKNFYTSSYFKNFANSLITAFLVVCILGLVNYLAFKNAKQFDFTANRDNSLSGQTLQILKGLTGRIQVKIFAPRSESAAHRAIADIYRYEKNDIDIEIIDPVVRPDLVKLYGIEKTGTMLLEYAGKRELVMGTTELEMTNALIRLLRDKIPVLFFLTGHGERSFKDDSPEGFSLLGSMVEKASYRIEEVDLRRHGRIDEFVDTVVIWGAKEELMDNEIKLLDAFLERGGGLVVGIDPDLNRLSAKSLRNLLEKYGIVISNDLIIDVESHIDGSMGTVPLTSAFNKSHPITRNMNEKIFFPVTSSVSSKAGVKAWDLVESSPFPGSWSEQNPRELIEGKTTYTEGQDVGGPVSFGVAVERGKTRIVAFGNSTFVSNKYGKVSSNFLFFLNSLAWPVGHDQLISFDTPVIKRDEAVFISRPQLGVIFYFSVLFVPVIFLLFSLYLYRRKKRL